MKGIEFLRARHRAQPPRAAAPRPDGLVHRAEDRQVGREAQFRRLFKADDDFHERDRPGRTPQERDNWLVAREKYLAAQRLADSAPR